MGADTLSDVLRTVRLTGAVFFKMDATSPWVAETPHASQIIDHVLPGVQHLISYHAVTHGSCWAGLVDEEPICLAAGDIVVFPHGDPHVVSSATGMRATAEPSFYQRPSNEQRPFMLHYGREGPKDVTLVCGYLGCDVRPFNPLLSTLPRLMHVRAATGQGNRWLHQFIDVAVAESTNKRVGGECVLARLSELMFVEVVRRHLETLAPGQTGWLAGLRDDFVGRALGLIHERPAYPWTLENLARETGISRSALAERFTELVGQPPIQYLTQWRMQIAAGLLGAGSSNVSEAAREVGYESEAAFSRAFKKLVGVPPAAWRKQAAVKPPPARALAVV